MIYLSKRVEACEKQAEEERDWPFPYYFEDALALAGLKGDEIYEKEIQQIFHKFQEEPENHLREHWFEIAILNSDDRGVELLLQWIERSTDESLIRQLVKLISKRYRALTYAPIVSRVISRAAKISGRFEREITNDLFFSIARHGQNYWGGIPQDRFYLEEARKQRERYRSDSTLFSFYDRVVKHEEDDERKHRQDWEKEKKTMSQFN